MEIRPERTVEQYSRGAELARAFRAMWEANGKLAHRGDISSENAAVIARRIRELMTDFDLTTEECNYWAVEVGKGTV
jgi:hypothetical protein